MDGSIFLLIKKKKKNLMDYFHSPNLIYIYIYIYKIK